MVLTKEFIEMLICPENYTPVALADAATVEKVNEGIRAGTLTNRAGQPITEEIEAGLLREDGKLLYPVRHEIPVMLLEEAIEIG